MTNVSHMTPFVVPGRILLAVSVVLYGRGMVLDATTDPNLKELFDISVAGLMLMVSFLAAYIGYSVSNRAALAPCAISAWVDNSFDAGFSNVLIAGMISGPVVYYLEKIPTHKVLCSVMPILVIPIVDTFITVGIVMWGFGELTSALTANLTGWLRGIRESSIVVLTIIMGLILALGMGGLVNKVVHAFMLICVSQGAYSMVAIATVGIAIPPSGIGLATLIDRKYFAAEEQETDKVALVIDCVDVTKGVIPLAATDPLHVIPVNTIGAASGCVAAALMGAQYYTGWGGLIILPVVQGKLEFVTALLVGARVSAACAILLKTSAKKKLTGVVTDDELDFDLEISR